MSKIRIKRAFEKVFALMLLDILIVTPLILSATANNVGVQVGDWAKYDINFDYTWVSETQEEPSFLQEAKARDWNNVSVIQIIDSAVRIEVITRVKNGTEFADTYFGDIATGEGNYTFPALITADRLEGDYIVDDPEAATINKTMTLNYAGANREVNFVPLFDGEVGWSSEEKRHVINGNGSIRYFYFDQKTGFLCQFELLSKESNATYGLIIHMNMVMEQTNLWVPNVFNGWWVVGATIIIVPVGLFCFSRIRQRKNRKVARHQTKHR
jgi:hypothetical protein